MPDDQGHETHEEALARLAYVSSSQLFGDNVTSAVISETAEADLAEVAKVEEDEPVQDNTDNTGVDFNDLNPFSNDDEEDNQEEELTAAQTIERIEVASSVEGVDALAVDDTRVTVQRAADKRRAELS